MNTPLEAGIKKYKDAAKAVDAMGFGSSGCDLCKKYSRDCRKCVVGRKTGYTSESIRLSGCDGTPWERISKAQREFAAALREEAAFLESCREEEPWKPVVYPFGLCSAGCPQYSGALYGSCKMGFHGRKENGHAYPGPGCPAYKEPPKPAPTYKPGDWVKVLESVRDDPEKNDGERDMLANIGRTLEVKSLGSYRICLWNPDRKNWWAYRLCDVEPAENIPAPVPEPPEKAKPTDEIAPGTWIRITGNQSESGGLFHYLSIGSIWKIVLRRGKYYDLEGTGNQDGSERYYDLKGTGQSILREHFEPWTPWVGEMVRPLEHVRYADSRLPLIGKAIRASRIYPNSVVAANHFTWHPSWLEPVLDAQHMPVTEEAKPAPAPMPKPSKSDLRVIARARIARALAEATGKHPTVIDAIYRREKATPEQIARFLAGEET